MKYNIKVVPEIKERKATKDTYIYGIYDVETDTNEISVTKACPTTQLLGFLMGTLVDSVIDDQTEDQVQENIKTTVKAFYDTLEELGREIGETN